jgi:hypothetical protein
VFLHFLIVVHSARTKLRPSAVESVQRHGQIDVEAEDLCIHAMENVDERDEKRSCQAVPYGLRER